MWCNLCIILRYWNGQDTLIIHLFDINQEEDESILLKKIVCKIVEKMVYSNLWYLLPKNIVQGKFCC
jgi:hypothetical protein